MRPMSGATTETDAGRPDAPRWKEKTKIQVKCQWRRGNLGQFPLGFGYSTNNLVGLGETLNLQTALFGTCVQQ